MVLLDPLSLSSRLEDRLDGVPGARLSRPPAHNSLFSAADAKAVALDIDNAMSLLNLLRCLAFRACSAIVGGFELVILCS